MKVGQRRGMILDDIFAVCNYIVDRDRLSTCVLASLDLIKDCQLMKNFGSNVENFLGSEELYILHLVYMR